MKKMLLIVGIGLGLLLRPVASEAQTPTVEALLQQIAYLQAQVQMLRQEYVQHHPDDVDHDQTFDLSEVLGVIQIYNVGHYYPCVEAETGFCPGYGSVRVPDVTGRLLGDGMDCDDEAPLGLWCELRTEGLIVEQTDITYVYSDQFAAGVVISSPLNGQSVLEGEHIPLIVSIGPAPLVPNVVGMTLINAENALMAAGIPVCGGRPTRYSTTLAAGLIAETNPPAGQRLVVYGDCATIVTSLGPEPVEGEEDGEGSLDGAADGEPEGSTDGEGAIEGEPDGWIEGEGECAADETRPDITFLNPPADGYHVNDILHLLLEVGDCGEGPFDGYLNIPTGKSDEQSVLIGNGFCMLAGEIWPIGLYLLSNGEVRIEELENEKSFQGLSFVRPVDSAEVSVLLTGDTAGQAASITFEVVEVQNDQETRSGVAVKNLIVLPARTS